MLNCAQIIHILSNNNKTQCNNKTLHEIFIFLIKFLDMTTLK